MAGGRGLDVTQFPTVSTYYDLDIQAHKQTTSRLRMEIDERIQLHCLHPLDLLLEKRLLRLSVAELNALLRVLFAWPSYKFALPTAFPLFEVIELVVDYTARQVNVALIKPLTLPINQLLGLNEPQIKALIRWPTLNPIAVRSCTQFSIAHLRMLSHLTGYIDPNEVIDVPEPRQHLLTVAKAFDQVYHLDARSVWLLSYESLHAEMFLFMSVAKRNFLIGLHYNHLLNNDIIRAVNQATWFTLPAHGSQLLVLMRQCDLDVLSALNFLTLLAHKGVVIEDYNIDNLTPAFFTSDYPLLNGPQLVVYMANFARPMVTVATFQLDWLNSFQHALAFQAVLEYFLKKDRVLKRALDYTKTVLALESMEQAAIIWRIYTCQYRRGDAGLADVMLSLQGYINDIRIQINSGAKAWIFDNDFNCALACHLRDQLDQSDSSLADTFSAANIDRVRALLDPADEKCISFKLSNILSIPSVNPDEYDNEVAASCCTLS